MKTILSDFWRRVSDDNLLPKFGMVHKLVDTFWGSEKHSGRLYAQSELKAPCFGLPERKFWPRCVHIEFRLSEKCQPISAYN